MINLLISQQFQKEIIMKEFWIIVFGNLRITPSFKLSQFAQLIQNSSFFFFSCFLLSINKYRQEVQTIRTENTFLRKDLERITEEIQVKTNTQKFDLLIGDFQDNLMALDLKAEMLSKQRILNEAILALSSLRRGGTFVMKIYDFWTR